MTFVFCAINAQTQGVLSVSVTTAATNMGYYSPSNVEAIWIEDSSNKFIKTLLVNGNIRHIWLDLWIESSAQNKVDAKTGATRSSHGTLTCTWNGKDANGNIVPDGSYKLRMQLTDDDFSGLNASFNFNKSTTTETLTPADVLPSFKAVSIKWQPANTALTTTSVNSPFKLYPNPAKSDFYVNGFDFKSITIYSLSGDLILKSQKQNININNLENGVYWAIIQSSDGTYSTKFIKN